MVTIRDKIVKVKIEDLKEYSKNNKNHPEEQISLLLQNIDQFGFTNPLLIDENNVIIAGHGRKLAADRLGYKELPCIRITDLSENQIKGLRMADNRVAALAEDNIQFIEEEFMELKESGLDYLTGWKEEDFEFEEESIEVNEDDFDAPEDINEIETDIKLGDVIRLGNHRLMCGSATSKDNYLELMDGAKADMIYTDPPYGMNAVSKSGVLSANYKTDILNDDDNTVAIESFKMFNRYAPFNIWWGANYYSECLPSSECWIVWDKNNGGSDQTDCELAWTNFRSVVRQFTQASEKVNRVHPTQKPVSLFVWCIDKFKSKGEFNIILDLFGGSGSTLIACEQLNRVCYMMELDEKYCEVICQRWEKLTGKTREVLNGSN